MLVGTKPENIESQLTGKTLLTYWYLLINSEVTVRQLTRELNFSSPSIATHHLTKLQSLNIAEKDETGKYYLTKYIPVGVLQHFIRFRGILLPRMFFLAVFFTSLLLLSVGWMVTVTPGIFDRILFVVFCVVGISVSWWETYRLYKLKIL
ncbi:MAG: winged helix-turn-helix domain-containing protein [Candidatus Thorarchaeota archaeon]